MTGYDFHPEALTDLDEIYHYIAEDSPDSAYLPRFWLLAH
jgi:plasmid stabilization system protein ParE